MRSTFRSFERLKRPADFVRARNQGRKKVGRFLVLWTFQRDETPPRAARLGVVVSRKNGGAAQRNLFKRRIRETFRLNKHRLSRGWDLVVAVKAQPSGPKTGRPLSAFPPEYADLRADFLELTKPLLSFDSSQEKS